MQKPNWFLGDKEKKDDAPPYLLGPFYKVHYQEKIAAVALDDWIARK